MKRSVPGLCSNADGSVAPTVALSLLALIAAGGIAFDYARLASMDTELQSAADHAALAAASQLDGKPGACARAAAAARTMITNLTFMANDVASDAVTITDEPLCDAIGNVRFYMEADRSPIATTDEDAKFVEILVDPRTARYALTPVVGVFSSGLQRGIALAGLGDAICRVPPLMLCNPHETSDPDFTMADYIGKGIRLVANDGGGNYAPGNFGFLEVGQGSGASALRAVLGRNGDPGNCSQGAGVTTEPGNMITLRDAINTRFDMYQNGLNQACNNDGSLCPPSANSRKDLLRHGNSCGFATGGGNNGWKEVANAYPPSVLTTQRDLTEAEIDALAPMGYPRDECHAVSVTGVCAGGRVGDGVWDRYAYFRSQRAVNYAAEGVSVAAMNNFLTNTFGTTTPTRNQVYAYEMANAAARLQQESVGGGVAAHGEPVCHTPGIQPGPTQIDRRVLSVAVINCDAEAVQGRTSNVEVVRWIDIFLVEPSVPRNRTENSDVYVEIIEDTLNRTEGGAIQTVRKSVPYLIE